MNNVELDSAQLHRLEQTAERSDRRERFERKKRNVKIAIGASVLSVLGVTIPFAYGASASNSMKVTNEIEAPETKAEVKSVEVGIQPITISTALSETVTTIANTTNTEVFGLTIPVQHTELRRAGTVKGNFTFDPQNVEATYDAETEEVTITVPSTALNTEVSVVTGTGRTEHVSEAGLKWALDSMGQFVKYADGILGTDSSKDPLLSQVINGTLGYQEALESIADLKAAEGVDQTCTEKIRGIKGFDKALTDEVKELSTKEVIASSFLDELDIKSSERRKLIEDAKLVFENGSTFVIGNDKEIAKRVDAYNDIFKTTTTLEPVTCDVNESTKFTVNNQEHVNE